MVNVLALAPLHSPMPPVLFRRAGFLYIEFRSILDCDGSERKSGAHICGGGGVLVALFFYRAVGGDSQSNRM